MRFCRNFVKRFSIYCLQDWNTICYPFNFKQCLLIFVEWPRKILFHTPQPPPLPFYPPLYLFYYHHHICHVHLLNHCRFNPRYRLPHHLKPRCLCHVHPLNHCCSLTHATLSSPFASTSAVSAMSTLSVSSTRVTAAIHTPIASVIVKNNTADNSDEFSDTSSDEFESHQNQTNFLGQIRDFTVCENAASGSSPNQNTLVINTSESESEEPLHKKPMFHNFTKLKASLTVKVQFWPRCRTLTKKTYQISSFKTHLICRRGRTKKNPCLDPYYIVAVCESPCQFHSGILSDLSAPDFKFLEHECDSGYDLF
jgi:hypothetical protein